MHIPLLQDLLWILCASVFVVWLFQRAKLPAVLGFLVTGMVIGPHGLSLIRGVHEVEVLSEIGVILLLFVIGMEFSLGQLNAIRRTVFVGGGLQVGLTIAVVMGVFMLLGFAWNTSLFVGFLFSLSSTAIVLKLLQDANQMGTPHGRIALGILLFQDIIVVPMMLFTPIMAGQTSNVWLSIGILLLKTVVIIGITLVSARYLVPRLFYAIAKTRSKELFLLTTIALCFAVAALTSTAGLSLALGAFLAGLIISESEYSHEATSNILPFRELFTSIFFVSIGMLFDGRFLLEHIMIVIPAVIGVFVLKMALAGAAAWTLNYPVRTVVLTGLSLFQVGEFAFILSKVGIEAGLLTPELNQYFLSISILTMAATPFVMIRAEGLSERVAGWFSRIERKQAIKEDIPEEVLEGHLVIIGYGVNGRNVSRAARYAHIPYVIIELNAETVHVEKQKGEHILFGDAVHDHILHHVNLPKARVVVVAISDPTATKKIVYNVRRISKQVHLIIRTRFVKEIEELLALGADEVIPEEFETSIEIFSRVLHEYLVPLGDQEKLVRDIRADNYEALQPQLAAKQSRAPGPIPRLHIECVKLDRETGPVVNKTLADANIRQQYGVMVLALSREEEMIHPIPADMKLQQGDRLYITGNMEDIEKFHRVVEVS